MKKSFLDYSFAMKLNCLVTVLFLVTSLQSTMARTAFYEDAGLSIEEILHFELDATPTVDECKVSVDPKKVLLYFDLNSAYREVVIAKKAACELGLRFVTIPGELASKNAGLPYESWVVARDKYGYCTLSSKTCSNATADRLKAELDLAQKVAENAAGPYVFTPKTLFIETINQLSRQEAKIVILGLSGHHYELGWYGDFLAGKYVAGVLRGDVFHEGSPDRDDIYEIARQKPEVFSSIKLITLWGCATLTPTKIEEWKTHAPNVQLILGFNSSAPAAIRESSLNFLKDSLKDGLNIVGNSNASRIRSDLNNLSSIKESFAGAYYKDSYGLEFLYRVVSPRSGSKGVNFEKYRNTSRCESFAKRMPESLAKIHSWEDGSVAIPPDGPNSDLWRIYFDFQMNADCYKNSEVGRNYSSSRIGLIRFFETGVKLNFLKVFSNIKFVTAELESESRNPNFASLLNFMGTTNMAAFIRTKNRGEIIKLSRLLTKTLFQTKSTPFLSFYARAIQKLLVELHPECTEILTWHEISNQNPIVSCKF